MKYQSWIVLTNRPNASIWDREDPGNKRAWSWKVPGYLHLYKIHVTPGRLPLALLLYV